MKCVHCSLSQDTVNSPPDQLLDRQAMMIMQYSRQLNRGPIFKKS